MNLADFLTRRAAEPKAEPRATCARCRKAVVTCYCHVLRPFESPVPFVILQHFAEARNAIATARMAHLSMTNSRLFVERGFAEHAEVNRLMSDASVENVVLYPSHGARPLEEVVDPAGGDGRQVVFWVLDGKWSQVPKLLRLSPNVRDMPRVRFTPTAPSTFQIRKQPRPAYLSTIECIYLVIDAYQKARGLTDTAHHALLDAFRYLVDQQIGFVDVEADVRHKAGRAMRAERRRLKALRVENGELDV
jgi:DTW domain-containing protein YfiP